ncbi:DUF1351 domain-containing protein [Thomasclavelia spiroformis]|uniref:DUF1351 domain-containing protein n=1 Tax=Thomasclavelia spiroformis TaxID=29348 RepID=UPI003990706B
MNELQQKLLGGYAAVRINNLDEFNKVVGFLAIKNCFLANNETVKRMKYPGTSTFVLYRADDGFIWWSPIADIDTKKYQLIDVKDLGLEQIDDQIILEANAVVVEEIKELTEENMTLVVMTKPEHVTIPSNIDELVALIPAIEAKANVVVDENNYKTFIAKGSGTVPLLRKYAKNLKDEKKKIKDAYMQSFDEFSNNVDKVINALEITAKKIDDEVKHFIDQQKESLRKEREIEINKLKEVLIENKMISKEYADKFNFDEKWLNASCSMKRFKEEVEAQFNSLIEKEKLDKQNIELLETTIINTCSIAGIDDSLVKRDKYKTLIKIGQNLGEVTKMITDDINTLKKQKEALLAQQKKDAETINLEAEKIAQGASLHVSLGVPTAQPDIKAVVTMPVTDDKTGEVIGHVSDEQVTVKVQTPPPSVPEDKIFSYTYTFEGNCKAILTFNKCLKVLSKVFKSFKYMEVK